ncbi:hypothetical protein ACNQKP_06920 [Bdellovibrio bacteriovorus]|uniref:hypothetical protein n=1 Tax=Bdellovibrio bacteriovorus TaxID=959 RepID=UPI003AA9884B
MLDLKSLKLKIEGQFDDCFLHGDYLFLVDRKNLYQIDFTKLIRNLAPTSPDKKLLYEFAFCRNDLFFQGQTFANTLLSLSFVKDNLKRIYGKISELTLSWNDVSKFLSHPAVPHESPGILHLEIYKGKVFFSSDEGVFNFKYKNKRSTSRKQLLCNDRALHIGANTGNDLIISGGHSGTKRIHIDNFTASVLITSIDTIDDAPCLESEMVYQDFVSRDLDNRLSYFINDDWKPSRSASRSGRQQRISQQKKDSFRKVNVLTEENSTLFTSEDSYYMAVNSRIVDLKSNKVKIYKLNWKNREEFAERKKLKKKRDFSNIVLFEKPKEFSLIGDNINGQIFKVYQTSFGLIVETDKGLYCVDDTNSPQHQELTSNVISKDETLKVRHFYRSQRYSHILAIIKENHLEIQADLSDYFMNPKLKNIRLRKPV